MKKSISKKKPRKKTRSIARVASKAKTDGSLDPIAQKLLRNPAITQTKMFGSIGLKTGDKVFAILCGGRFVLKLPVDEVSKLVARGEGAPFDPGHGRVMKGWVVMNSKFRENWFRFAKRSHAFVASLG